MVTTSFTTGKDKHIIVMPDPHTIWYIAQLLLYNTIVGLHFLIVLLAQEMNPVIF